RSPEDYQGRQRIPRLSRQYDTRLSPTVRTRNTCANQHPVEALRNLELVMPSWSLSAKILIAFAAILIGFTIFDGMSRWVASHWIIGAVIIGTLALLLLIGLGIQ